MARGVRLRGSVVSLIAFLKLKHDELVPTLEYFVQSDDMLALKTSEDDFAPEVRKIIKIARKIHDFRIAFYREETMDRLSTTIEKMRETQ